MALSLIEAHFPSGIAVPAELRALCMWHGANGYPISGGFELRASDDEVLVHWFGCHAADDRLGVFGAGPDGSLFALWRQDDGECRVVHLGSEGQNNFVLARSFVEFLQLLAVGYNELGFDNLQGPPEAEGINPAFRAWVTRTFSVIVPSRGQALVSEARAASQDFDAWIQTVIA